MSHAFRIRLKEYVCRMSIMLAASLVVIEPLHAETTPGPMRACQAQPSCAAMVMNYLRRQTKRKFPSKNKTAFGLLRAPNIVPATSSNLIPNRNRVIVSELQPADYKPLTVRADREDTYYTGVAGNADGNLGVAKGASLSYGGNLRQLPTSPTGAISHPLTASVQGFVSYNLAPRPILFDAPVSAFSNQRLVTMPSLFLETSGSWDQPSKITDYSYLRLGPNENFGLYSNSNSLIQEIFGNINAYYQTDYFGKAQAHGISATLSPNIPSMHIGSASNTSELVTFYVIPRPEIDYNSVQNPGHTQLSAHEYVWTGGTLRGYALLFQSPADQTQASNYPPFLRDRLVLSGGLDLFHDLNSNAAARAYSASLAYTLVGCKPRNLSPKDAGTTNDEKINPNNDRSCTRDGAASLAFQYSGGENKELYVYQHKYALVLTYKY